MNNTYLQQVHQNLPRLLALYNSDSTSQTYGVGDRFYWSWKLIDFPNGTFQASAYGLSLLLKHQMLPEYIDHSMMLARIDAIFDGTKAICHNNGSLDEALPYEYSFCVTGLVASDLIGTIENLSGIVSVEKINKWIEIIRPMISFLSIQDEYHGVISNHLATNALALVRWADLVGSNSDDRALVWVNRIVEHQSNEGWFSEYGGADFGYQTWCTSSLSEISKRRPSWILESKLIHSIEFLSIGAFPNGMFGGVMGSRMTEFIFPSGVVQLGYKSPLAYRLSEFFAGSINSGMCVNLDVIDMGNFVPLFNDYVKAAVAYEELKINEIVHKSLPPLPFELEDGNRLYPDSGLFCLKNKACYSVMNLKKGGTGVSYCDNGTVYEIPAFIGKDSKGRYVSNQVIDNDAVWSISEDKVVLSSFASYVRRPTNSAVKFLILRALSLTFFKSLALGNMIKVMLAKLLISGHRKSHVRVIREIDFANDLIVCDKVTGGEAIEAHNFRQIHMASMGYWTRAHESKKTFPLRTIGD